MDQSHDYRFTIDAYTPETIPLARLAEYMKDLAALLGERKHVHFVRLESGSTSLLQRVDPEAAPKIKKRIDALNPSNGTGPDDALRAFRALDRLLAEDNAVGRLCDYDGAVIIRFPGREKPRPLTFGAFSQPGSLDGVLIKIGGKDDTVPVHLQDGKEIHICTTTREMARRLAPHLFGATLRVQGHGRWERDAEGVWRLDRFYIDDFETLDDAPLGAVVERLRRVAGSDWAKVDDPYAELQHLRHGSGGAH
ncbi:hypothetical protein [uncultured Thiodictyon sp.]|uniref:hypothetical protein n=1 Tax=uncultured Thiodictyon sp. TaxID=1846217 RepID=UPI0025D4596E|nr:hypothetical protein [uncultured Thiodictyon sp.]